MTQAPNPAPPGAERHYDCLVISDLHLGSGVCQAQLLESFLEWAVSRTGVLVMNGDIFDDLNFKRLNKRHFACLKIIRRNSDRADLRLVWIRGNHDGPADIVSHIVGVDIHDEYVYENGQIRLLIFHGDQFDTFVTHYRWLSAFACRLFYWIQKCAPHSTARWVRRISKRFQRNSQLVQQSAIEYARARGCRYVTCGHTHLALKAEVDGITYLNSGTWTEQPPCPFVSVKGSEVRLEAWPLEAGEPEAEGGARAEEVSQSPPSGESIAQAAANTLR